MRRPYSSMQERLLANSHTADVALMPECQWNGIPCRLWDGARNKGGYGTLNVRWKSGPRKGKVRTLKAHRVAVQEFTGRKMRKDHVGMHYCNIHLCIEPAHTGGGSQATNMKQCVREARHRSPFYPTDHPRHLCSKLCGCIAP